LAYGAAFALGPSVPNCVSIFGQEYLVVKSLLQRMIREDDGVLTFEWVLIITIVVVGIVSGLAAARDGIVDEIGDSAEAMIALDQSYYVDFPLAPYIIGDGTGPDFGPIDGASDSGFTDFAVSSDCARNGVPGQFTTFDEN
jgi:hypothetical protein